MRNAPARGAGDPNIQPKADRKWKNCFSLFLYLARNPIERMLPLERLRASGDAL
jgi:hypothetical protein